MEVALVLFVSVVNKYVGSITEMSIGRFFNSDGRKDVAAINLGSNSISVLLTKPLVL